MNENALRIQRCERCAHHWFPERIACGRCGAASLVAVPAGEGVVVDRVDVLRAPSDAGDGPVVIALVQLDAGPRVLARAASGTAASAPAAGERVSLVDLDGGVHLRAV